MSTDVINLRDHSRVMAQQHKLPRHNVNFLIFNQEGKLLVINRFCKKSFKASGQSDPSHHSVEQWKDIPGGRVDHPESHIRAIIRENLEELDIVVSGAIELSKMDNPTPGCREGSTRSIYIVTNYEGEIKNKAGLDEGHLDIEWIDPFEAAMVLGNKIDVETKQFLCDAAEAFKRGASVPTHQTPAQPGILSFAATATGPKL